MEKMAVFTQTVVKFYSKNQVFGHKKSEKSTRIFLNTDFGKEKNLLTGNTYIYQQTKFSKSYHKNINLNIQNIINSLK
jgi:hypothetical protein